MALKDPVKRREYLKRYRVINRERLAAADRARRHIDLVYERRRRALAHAFIDAAMADGCVDCGNKNLSVLDLDHVRGVKVFDMAHMPNMALPRVFAEIDKCETRCANCHRIVTAQRRKEKRLAAAS